jgi:hypothetical protein
MVSQDASSIVVLAVGFHRDQRTASLELFVVVTRLVLWNSHSGEGPDDAAGCRACRRAAENSGKKATRYHRTYAGDQPGCQRPKDSADHAACNRPCSRASAGVTGVAFRANRSLAVTLVSNGNADLIVVESVSLQRVDGPFRVISISKNPDYR